jgi:hypothetical protein
MVAAHRPRVRRADRGPRPRRRRHDHHVGRAARAAHPYHWALRFIGVLHGGGPSDDHRMSAGFSDSPRSRPRP